MSSRVGIGFDGNSAGVVRAASQTVAAVQSVSKSVAATSLETAKFGSATRSAEAEVSRLGRGALAGTGIMSGFGRSIAFASAAFIGAEGFLQVVRTSIDQAETLQRAHQSLDVSVTRLGGNFRIASGEIDAWAKNQQRFGISITDSEQGLARLIPLTGSVAKAMEAYTLALQLSKGDNVDLSSAETAVAKALDGKTASLQRYGIVLNKNATDEQVAAAISQRFGGQAIANTTAMDRLHASVSNFELALGQALLPTIDHVAGSLTKWLSNQHNVNRVTGDAKQVIGDTVSVVKTMYDWAEKVSGALGGWKNTFEILIGLKVVSVLGGWSNSIYKLGGLMNVASGEAKGLMGWLAGLRNIGPIIIPVGLAYFTEKYGAKNVISAAGAGGIDATLGPGISSDQTVTVGGKQFPIGTSAAITALRSAGFKGPLDNAVQEERAAKSLGGSTSLTGGDISSILKAISAGGQASVDSAGLGGTKGFGGSIPVGASGGSTGGVKKPAIVTGANLIPSDLRDEISTLADKAKNAAGAALVADLKGELAA